MLRSLRGKLTLLFLTVGITTIVFIIYEQGYVPVPVYSVGSGQIITHSISKTTTTNRALTHTINKNDKQKTYSAKKNNILSKKTFRKDECKNCFLHDFKYVILNDKICSVQNGETVDMFIIIFSIPKNIANRNAIRKTWASVSKNNTANTRYAFFFGDSSNKNILFQEATIYKDIIMEDFHDSYQNLTYKTMMGFKFVHLFCNHSKYVLKTDDDMWINLNSLYEYLGANTNYLYNAVGGRCMLTAMPIRDKRSKWYASLQNYPQKTYPGFCSGTGYILTSKTAQKVFEISKDVPYFYLEDVYVSLCIKKLGYILKKLAGFLAGTGVVPNLCRYKQTNIISWHQVPPIILLKIWSKTCAELNESAINQQD